MDGRDAVERFSEGFEEEELWPFDRAWSSASLWCEHENEQEIAALSGSLVSAFGEAARALSPQSERIRRAISAQRSLSTRRRRTLRVVLALYGCAAIVLALLWVGYVAVYRFELREALTASTRMDVRNLGRALERWAEHNGGVLPSVQDGERLFELLARSSEQTGMQVFEVPKRWVRDGVLVDAFGSPLRYRLRGAQVVLYSCGPDGRDDAGGADDIAIVLRRHPASSRDF